MKKHCYYVRKNNNSLEDWEGGYTYLTDKEPYVKRETIFTAKTYEAAMNKLKQLRDVYER